MRQAALGLAALVGLVPEAHAYLDPGTGSILLQGLIAAIAGALVAIRMYWGKIVSFFRRRRREPE